MAFAARVELARVLGEVAAARPSGVRLLVDPAALVLEVASVSHVGMPLSAAQAKELIELGRPARFGRGERTVTDRRVRDTWELPKRLVQARWSAVFESALEKVRDGLGLTSDCRLTAELHSVLVYEPGQFFLPHQDSEKDDTMVATLVVTVPSAHTGGDFVIGRGERSTTYRASKTKISMVAFYADTLHEVLPVTSGYRMTLTYNLLLEGSSTRTAGDDVPGESVEELAGLLDSHLTTRRKHRYRDEVLDPPNRLVYLLDHEYTARGLSWARLKGSDATRAAALRAAAEAGECDVALGLAEIQETWDALEPEHRYTRRRWSDEDQDDDHDDDAPDSDHGPEGYELQDLIDSSIRLTRWTDPAGAWTENISLSLHEDEVCASTPTAQLRPYESEYEGYMGNYGNTMDRWYRRAAVVVWPRARSFEIRAEISPAQALDEVLTRLRSARSSERAEVLEQARTQVTSLAPFWDGLVRSQGQIRLLTKALRAATVLDDPRTATTLLSAFRVEALQPAHAKALTKLARRHGEPWVAGLLTTWFGDPRRPQHLVTEQTRQQWLTMLPALAATLDAEQDTGRAVGRSLLALAWRQLLSEIDLWLTEPTPSRQQTHLARLGEPLTALLHAAAVLDAAALAERIVGDICNRRHDAVLLCAIPALRSAERLPAAVRERAGLARLARDCAARLRSRTARPARADGDWSIDLPDGCGCELCTELGTFLRDPSRTTRDWPLAEQRRRHVHDRIDRAELPVTHTTRRQGRPYTLVLTKQPTLFDLERRARAQDHADLARLARVWDTPG